LGIVAEEEGDSNLGGIGGNRWYALVRYARNFENMGFAISRVKRAFERFLISSFFVANVARERDSCGMPANLNGLDVL
jgi:hypothetical protein